MSEGYVGNVRNFPYIKASSWVKILDRHSCLHRLLGLGEDYKTLEKAGPVLQQFWDKYALTNGGHQIYGLANRGEVCLSECLPIYIHGDEGTTIKKDGALVVSIFCPIGQGVAGAKTGENPEQLQLNFVGHGFTTRYVLATLMKACISCQNLGYRQDRVPKHCSVNMYTHKVSID